MHIYETIIIKEKECEFEKGLWGEELEGGEGGERNGLNSVHIYKIKK